MKTSITPEDELINKAKAGDRDSFSKLVEVYGPRMELFLISRSKNFHQAKEVAQITWIKIWKKLKDFKGESSFSTWSTRIAINALLDEFRKNSKTLSIEDLKFEDEGCSDLPTLVSKHVSPQDSPFEILDAKERSQQDAQKIIKLMSLLDEVKKRVVDLVLVKRLSYKEAAKIEKIPVGTVMSRLHYAKRQMQSFNKR